MSALSQDVSQLKEEVAALRSRVSSLESDEAIVSTVEESYAIARTKFGPFAFVSSTVTPYLDGYRARLRVGNLTGAFFQGAKVKVTWGAKHREFDLTTEFPPGKFTIVEVALTPAVPEEVKSIRVGIELTRMGLLPR